MAIKANFSEAEAFLAVAASGGFGLAARELGVTQSTISRRISSLEARVGKRLIERTTRRLALTEAGRAYSDELRKILQSLENAEAMIQNEARDPAGLVKVTMPTSLGRACILPCIRRLTDRYPGLRFELDLSDRYVDLRENAFDLAVRLKAPQDSGIDVIKVGQFKSVLCAAPSYLATFGQPLGPADVADHRYLALKTYAPRISWTGQWCGKPFQLQAKPYLTLNDSLGLRNLTLDAVGMAVLPMYLVSNDLEEGALVDVLPDFILPGVEVFVAFPRKSRDLEKVKVLVDEIRLALSPLADTAP